MPDADRSTESAFLSEQRVSAVSSNRFRRGSLFDEAEKHSLRVFDEESDALYDAVSEKQSMQNATERLDSDGSARG